ncbi:MAG: ArsR family transcriptional regulator [Candidatus Dadabacteria bacterium]|nr:MAG: ArsR family transcriptional regulator [Candidatus Dadabacteria bacterium]
MDVERISAEEARARAKGCGALLVCAYEDEKKCDALRLEGALTLKEFRERAPALDKAREIVFYCA